jgi:transformer-2 protein
MRDDRGDDGAINPGSNLFVTGIHPKLTEAEVTRLFEKYGEVEKCQIMRDPHSKESRGFGFVKMVTSDMADAAKEGLQGEVIEGRTLSIEKARRARPRTPTPGKYFGPPKRGKFARSQLSFPLTNRTEDARPGGGRFNDRFDDRRRGGYGGGGGGYGRDDPYRYRGYGGGDDRRGGYDRGGGYERGYREDRGYDRGYRGEDRGYGGGRDRDGGDSYSSSRIDRYAGGREERGGGERYGGRGGGEERRGGGGGYNDRDRYDRGADRAERPARDAAPPAAGYGDSGARTGGREDYGGMPRTSQQPPQNQLTQG